MAASNKRFTIEKQSDALEFWSWFINQLHTELTGGKRKRPSIISRCFQVIPMPRSNMSCSVISQLPTHLRVQCKQRRCCILNCFMVQRPGPDALCRCWKAT